MATATPDEKEVDLDDEVVAESKDVVSPLKDTDSAAYTQRIANLRMYKELKQAQRLVKAGTPEFDEIQKQIDRVQKELDDLREKRGSIGKLSRGSFRKNSANLEDSGTPKKS